MQKKRIFYLITRSEPGGAQSHVLELLRGLREDYDLYLGAGEKGFLLDAANELGIATFYIPHMARDISLINDYKAYHEIRAVLEEIEPDLVHCHSSKAGVLGRIAAHKLGIKCIFTAHGWAFAKGTPWSRKLVSIIPERLLAYWTDRIITVSKTDRQLALHYHIGTEEKLITIHNGIADISQAVKQNVEEKPVSLIMIARFAPPKNFSDLLSSVAGITQDFRLELVGDGPLFSAMQKKSQSLGLTEKVEFMGSRDDVVDLLAAADIFVLISDWEGFPISILEAMRAGLPVVATDVGGVNEAIQRNINGVLVKCKSVDGISRALQTLLNDKSLRKKMGLKSREIYESEFTADMMLKKLSRLYQSVIFPIGGADHDDT